MTHPASATRSGPGRSLPERRRRERRVLLIGLVVSLVVHVLVLGWVGDRLARAPEPADPSLAPRVYVPPSGMRAVELAPAPDPASPAEVAAPEPEPEPAPAVEPEPTRRAPEVAAAPADSTSVAATAADRLAPRVVDPRLYEPLVVLPWEPSLEDVQARIGAAVELLSDSALAEAEAAIRARDWTVEDADGGRWGISPGRLHLGDITIPLPIFPTSFEAAEAQRRWYELDQQQERALILESFEERVRAIRERRERERAEAREGNGG